MLKEITVDELNNLTLDSHFLVSGPLPEEMTEAVEQICGLNAQSARGPYLSLWNRIEGFSRESLTEALYKEKTLIKAWLMRGTVHIVPTVDFPIYQKALRRSLSDGWEGSLKKQNLIDLPRTWNRLLDAIVKSLSEEPLVRKDLLGRVKGLVKGYTQAEQKRLVGWALRALTYKGIVCHGRPTGPWYHFKDNRFALVGDWLNPDHIEETHEEEARHDLLIKYLGGYGPATIQDFAYWTGFRMPLARQVFESALERLCEITVTGTKHAYWVLEEACGSLQDREQKPPVCFLPEFDPLVMGHKDKSRIIDETDRKQVFRRLAVVAPTLLVNGRVAGTWDYKFSDGSLTVQPFDPLPEGTQKALTDASERLLSFLKA